MRSGGSLHPASRTGLAPCKRWAPALVKLPAHSPSQQSQGWGQFQEFRAKNQKTIPQQSPPKLLPCFVVLVETKDDRMWGVIHTDKYEGHLPRTDVNTSVCVQNVRLIVKSSWTNCATGWEDHRGHTLRHLPRHSGQAHSCCAQMGLTQERGLRWTRNQPTAAQQEGLCVQTVR